MTYALSTFSGEDVPTPYMRGLAYNKTLIERAAQQASGWTASIELARVGVTAAAISVAIKSKDGMPRNGLTIDATLRRPTDAALDRTVRLQAGGDGLYRAAVANVAAGQWDVVVRDAASGGASFEATRRVMLP